VVVLVQLVAASESWLATLAAAVKSGEIQSPLGAQTRVLVPLAAVIRMDGVPGSLPLLEPEGLEEVPSPQPTSKVKVTRPILPKTELRLFLKPSMFYPFPLF
jgi:hypothetical protein